jgi:hypothetical protein
MDIIINYSNYLLWLHAARDLLKACPSMCKMDLIIIITCPHRTRYQPSSTLSSLASLGWSYLVIWSSDSHTWRLGVKDLPPLQRFKLTCWLDMRAGCRACLSSVLQSTVVWTHGCPGAWAICETQVDRFSVAVPLMDASFLVWLSLHDCVAW